MDDFLENYNEQDYKIEVTECMSCGDVRIVYVLSQPCLIGDKEGNNLREGAIVIKVCSTCTTFPAVLHFLKRDLS